MQTIDDAVSEPHASALLQPLSRAQARLWFLHRLQPQDASYHVGRAWRLRGELDRQRLQDALTELVRRHPALRTTYHEIDGDPYQSVNAPASLEVGDVEANAAGLQAAVRLPFDLERDIMLRAFLACNAPDDHTLLLVIHHIACDGWSLCLLGRELATLYRGDELPASLASPSHAAEAGDDSLPWWLDQLRGLPEHLGLPYDRPTAGSCRPRAGGVCRSALPSRDRVDDFARRSKTTPFMVFTAVYQILLHRLGGERDIAIGTPVARRPDAAAEGVVGVFLNMLVLRSRLADAVTFEQLLAQVREVTLQAFAHHDTAFERLVEELQPARGARHPLFEAALVLQPEYPPLQLAGLEAARSYDVHPGHAKFTLLLSIEGDQATLEYDATRFTAATGERWLRHFITLLEAAMAHPSTEVDRLPLLTPSERHAMLRLGRGSAPPCPRDMCVHELFENWARRTPNEIAVVAGETRLSYGELDRRSNGFAHWLRQRGVQATFCVAVRMSRSAELVIALLGILKAGGAYVALDAAWPDERRRLILQDSRAVCVVEVGDVGLDEAESPPPTTASAEAPAYVCYTSGSTGQPKGVAVTHRGVVRLVWNAEYVALGPDEVLLGMAPLAFDASTFELWGALLNGGKLVMMEPGTPSLGDVGRAVRQHGVTTLWLTTGLFNLMVDECLDDLRGLRQILFGGEVASPSHVTRARLAMPSVRLLNMYGPTENTTFTTAYAVTDDRTPVPIGRPIANDRLYVVDALGEPVPVGVIGELWVGGDGVARGYLGRSDLTEASFGVDVFGAGGRVYRTGDRVRWLEDGNLEFVGRSDDQIKIRGFRIEPAEIESVLGAHGSVARCAVVVREDDGAGKRLVAYLVRYSGAPSDDWRQWLRERLPEYMVPAAFVELDHLPLNANGKVERRALPLPASGGRAGVARTPTEQKLTAIWQTVLRREVIGADDPFFELGGHSLLGVQLLAHIERILGRRVPLAVLFERQTIRELAHVLDAEQTLGVPRPTLVDLQPRGHRTPIFWVHSLGGDGGGGFLYYRKLARLLGTDRPSIGIRAPQEPFEDVVAMARFYIAEVRRRQPSGPYLLGGFCFGGVVAAEMATQLEAAGETVALLVLIDSMPPRHAQVQAPGLSRRVSATLERVRELWPAPMREKRRVLAALCRRWRKGAKSADLSDVIDLSHYPADYVEAAQKHWRALQHFAPRPFGGRTLLFGRARSSWARELGDDYGWGALARGGVRVVEVEGDHQSILEEPGVQRIASVILSELQGQEQAGQATR